MNNEARETHPGHHTLVATDLAKLVQDLATNDPQAKVWVEVEGRDGQVYRADALMVGVWVVRDGSRHLVLEGYESPRRRIRDSAGYTALGDDDG